MTVSDRDERAARRARSWQGAVIRVGDPKGLLHQGLSVEERLAAFVALNRRAWAAAEPAQLPTSEWPGEIFFLRADS